MTEDQLLNLVVGDRIHEHITSCLYDEVVEMCRNWTIDYKIDKYVAHGVVFLNDEGHNYMTCWFRHEDLDRIHLPEECPTLHTLQD